MSSQTRGHKIKADLSSLPLVRHIPSKAIVSDRMQPTYYEYLAALADQDLDIIQQSLAILLARSYTTMMEILLYRDKVLNETDVPIWQAPLDDLDKITKSYSELVKTFYSVTKQTQAKEEPETETMDAAEILQAELTRLRNDRGDSGDSSEE